MKAETRVTLWILSIALAATAPASALDVPGGGPAKSDCYVGFDVEATPTPTLAGKNKVTAKACAGSCTFAVEACINVPVTNCTAPTVTAATVTPSSSGIAAPATPGSAHACGAAANVIVALKGKKKNKPGKATLKLVGTADGVKPKKDVDKLRLVCAPNDPGDPGCAAPSTPLPGPRTFTAGNGTPPSGFFSNAQASSSKPPGVAAPNSFVGSIALVGGTPGADGIATLAVAADSIVGWDVIAGQGSICLKIEAAGSAGKIDCDGGTPVDVTLTGDSHGNGGNDDPVLQTEQGAPGAAGAGYFTATTRSVNCPADPACVSGFTKATDCATKVNYDMLTPTVRAFTTGTATATVQNPKPTSLGKNPTARTGQPFDCNKWTNGPGVLEMPLVSYDSGIAGDTANMLELAD